MSLNIVSLRRMVWKPLGFRSDDQPALTRDEIDLYLNRAFWEIQDKFPFREKERTATFATVKGVRNYDVPQPFEAILHIAIEHPTTKVHSTLKQITTQTYEGEQPTDPHFINTEENEGMPEKYVREHCFIRLWPTPDRDYIIIQKRLITLNDISNDNSVPHIPRVWHEIIGYGGLWRAYLDFGDFQRAEHIKQHAATLIATVDSTESKEKAANTAMAGLQVIRNDYP